MAGYAAGRAYAGVAKRISIYSLIGVGVISVAFFAWVFAIRRREPCP